MTDQTVTPLVSLSVGDDDLVPNAVEAIRSAGAVLLRGLLSPDDVARYGAIVDDWHGRFLRGEIQNYSLDDESATELPEVWESTFTEPRERQSLRKWNAAGLDKAFVELADSHAHYDVMLELLGTQISVTKSQFLVVPVECIESPYLHTDAGSMADIVPSAGSEPLMCSVQIFLSKLDSPNMGNFTCVPGSHTEIFPWTDDNDAHSQIRVGKPLGQGIADHSKVQVEAEPGDAILFLHSLWHGVSPNESTSHRRSMIYSYARSFVRPYDYETTPALVLSEGTERQRRLFGDLGGWSFRPGCNYHYSDSLRTTIGR